MINNYIYNYYNNIYYINIYTDGSVLGNPGPGSYAIIINFFLNIKILTSKFIYRYTTNNRMELYAIIEAIKYINNFLNLKKVIYIYIYTDSKYIINTIKILNIWVKKKFFKKKNIDLWKIFFFLKKKNIYFYWIKGHNNNFFNEKCNYLAKKIVKDKKKKKKLIDYNYENNINY
ncbi:MAG: ribonuclease HI [Candidatus Shikimatogenerans bostrichidophilus]|nr:MAG: ribonuclease HI [Candidatus Shikimatogenerans bostrichidophilus]